jgi:hypothetical protein
MTKSLFLYKKISNKYLNKNKLSNDIYIEYLYNKDSYNSILKKLNLHKIIVENVFIYSEVTIDNYYKLTQNTDKIFNDYTNINAWNIFKEFLNNLTNYTKCKNIFILINKNYELFECYLNKNINNCTIKIVNTILDSTFRNYYNKYNIRTIKDNNLLNNYKTVLLTNNKLTIEPNNVYGKYNAEKYEYNQIFNNNYAFCGLKKDDNMLVVWGDKSYGGYCPYKMLYVTKVIPTPLFFIAINKDNHCIIWGNITTYFKNIIEYINIGSWHIINSKLNNYHFLENDSSNKSIITKNINNIEVINMLQLIITNSNKVIILIKTLLIKRIYEKIKSNKTINVFIKCGINKNS